MKSVKEIDVGLIKTYLHYTPTTGVFKWITKPSRAVNVGDTAGCVNKQGYVQITLKRRGYKAHRLAVVLMTGENPAGLIDHMDHDTTNNIWTNLRQASDSLNQGNKGKHPKSKNAFKGVHICRNKRRFRAGITVSGHHQHLGYFDTPEEAHEAYKVAAVKHFGEFARFS